MANNSVQVLYSGQLYLDAKKVADAVGNTFDGIVEKSNSSLVKNIANAKERKAAFLDAMITRGVESDFDGYIAAKGTLTSFCTLFLLNTEKYIVDINEIVKAGKKIENPKDKLLPAPKPEATLTDVGEIVDMLLDENKEISRLLNCILTEMKTTGKQMANDIENTREHIQKIGPKTSSIDEKLKEIKVNTGILSKTWPGLVSNIGELRARFERWTSGRC